MRWKRRGGAFKKKACRLFYFIDFIFPSFPVFDINQQIHPKRRTDRAIDMLGAVGKARIVGVSRLSRQATTRIQQGAGHHRAAYTAKSQAPQVTEPFSSSAALKVPRQLHTPCGFRTFSSGGGSGDGSSSGGGGSGNGGSGSGGSSGSGGFEGGAIGGLWAAYLSLLEHKPVR
jgi:uncharacterized membrane protein YgcG